MAETSNLVANGSMTLLDFERPIQKLESQWRDHIWGVHGIELPVPQGVGRIIPCHGKLVGGFGHRVSNLWHVQVCKIITESLFGYPLFRPQFA